MEAQLLTALATGAGMSVGLGTIVQQRHAACQVIEDE